MPPVAAFDPLTRHQRLVAGVFILIVVDIIWVSSSEFTKYIFTQLSFEKPFFTTYAKTALFMAYLVGFLLHKPWRDGCRPGAARLREALRHNHHSYSRILQHGSGSSGGNETDALSISSSGGEDNEEGGSGEGTSYGTYGGCSRSLSSPVLVPVRGLTDEGARSSGTEESDGGVALEEEEEEQGKRVRFKEVAEVVEMNPGEAIAANLSRLSYNASIRAQAALRRAASRLTISEVASIAAFFTLPWFLGNYSYQMALAHADAALVNILSSSSCLFTLVFAALFPSDDVGSDHFTLSKLLAIIFNIAGVVLVSYSDITTTSSSSSPSLLHESSGGKHSVAYGVMWSLCGAMFFSLYLVLLRRKVQHEDNMDPPMFFGFVGLFSTVCLWPVLLLLDTSGVEKLELPSAKQWEFLIVNGLIGTVVSELLWLVGCFYTSNLMATMAIGLTIPLSMAADILWQQRSFQPLFIIGAIPMFCSFFVIALLTNHPDWDPIRDFFSSLCCCSCCCSCWQRQCRTRLLSQQQQGNSRWVPDQMESRGFSGNDERESLLFEGDEGTEAAVLSNGEEAQLEASGDCTVQVQKAIDA